jgi:hypothetical protein
MMLVIFHSGNFYSERKEKEKAEKRREKVRKGARPAWH